MSGKSLSRVMMLCVGINGFIMVSLGTVLLVLQSPTTFLTIGLIVLGTGHLAVLGCPNPEKKILRYIVLLNLAMVFLIISGLTAYLQAEGFFRMAGIACLFWGLLILAACNILLAAWFLTGNRADAGSPEKEGQKTDGKLFDNYLDSLIQAKLLKHRSKFRRD
ncbi:MAG TPA: hypothetical protein PLD49_04895 [Thermoclostridium caenicola]|uniref:Uncharacterized protein n=1 Tax=Thermoclostridium caenicola TaxID=659425 RepID=A0A1M6CKB2_9FIRM|nr:hypothetical protein [Thermoclostridium caenicola]SHI61409.1 hypothetical protein SAMN05444373_100549 [Thermoclostridium caenicola]HOK42983.1 hypothetical protein [Thermoclostridium caenicola]HOL85100.1 hypothetical protein [Thermoclostridium caenicola]HPO77513.1 hypothetical protein [Thermoclostridium caenicola]HPU21780.1 hypothetical protein [Thermoclostridium caenicola]